MPGILQQTQHDYLTTELRDSVVILKFQGDFFRVLTDLGQLESINKFFSRISKNPDLKTLVIHSFFTNAGVEEYLKFFGECKWRQGDMLHRFYNALDQIIVGLMELDKLVVHTCRGDLLSIFMGIGLACDYRIVADDTLFQHAFSRRGMLPKGGSPFFLSRMLGRGRALELLLLKSSISAEVALSHGIVDRVVPPEDLEHAALEIAGKFHEIPLQTLMGVKRLINFSSQDLKVYLNFESHQIGQLIRCNQIAGI